MQADSIQLIVFHISDFQVSMTCRLLSVAIRSNFGIIGSDEGLTLETSVLKLFTVVNFRDQLSWYH